MTAETTNVPHLVADLEGRPCVLVPLDHESVLQPRLSSHVYERVRERLDRDEAATVAFMDRLRPSLEGPELDAVPLRSDSPTEPFWNNGYFSGLDARAAHAVCAELVPNVVLEVGSGHSTKFMRKAIDARGRRTRLVSVDPAPRAEIDLLCDEVVRSPVQALDPELFSALEPGDVLFWDGSHLALNGADAVFLFLEVMPRLRPGVLVHVHDVTLPQEYPNDFDGRGYAEQYLLASWLLGNERDEVVLPAFHWSSRRGGPGGVSFWLRRGTAAAS
ncbi:MAG: class I SAM-dependent methyltransferase [Acidobacteriota bacterium]